jgi:hypothetical protein
MHQPDQNCQSTLALGGKGLSWAALNFQEQSGLHFHSRENGWLVLGPWKTPMTFAPPQIKLSIRTIKQIRAGAQKTLCKSQLPLRRKKAVN